MAYLTPIASALARYARRNEPVKHWAEDVHAPCMEYSAGQELNGRSPPHLTYQRACTAVLCNQVVAILFLGELRNMAAQQAFYPGIIRKTTHTVTQLPCRCAAVDSSTWTAALALEATVQSCHRT